MKRYPVQLLGAVMLLAALLLSFGCNPFRHDPEKTVLIEISHITERAEQEEVQEILIGMTDGSGHTMTTRFTGDQLIIKLSPVSDVQAFARRINFGHVTEIEGRTVRIDYVKYKKSV